MSQHEFQKNGFAVFADALDAGALSVLRTVCDELLAEPIDDGGNGRHKIGLGHDRRFLAHRHEEFQNLEALILGPVFAEMARDCLGREPLLFNEQFVVKGPDTGASFAWHQDSAYVGYDHAPYVSLWVAIDDATIENGCVYILPRDLDAHPGIDPHEWNDDHTEMNGYFGEDPGAAMICKAGTVVAFSSRTLHRSGTNVTPKHRRAYLAQYSCEPIKDPETGELKRFAKPMRGAE